MSYAGDPSAPPSRNTIIETVRNKNNKEDVRLRRRLTEYSKELATKIIQIDHDRLDAFDFLRQLRMCESDYMSEFAAWVHSLIAAYPCDNTASQTVQPEISLGAYYFYNNDKYATFF